MDTGLLVPRSLTPQDWHDTVDPAELMAESVTWERATSFLVTYIDDEGASATVVLVFSLPVDDDSCRLLTFPIDVSQVGVITLEMAAAVAAAHGKTLDVVLEQAHERIRNGDV